ncbi:hypothetical protein KUCAC02_006424 [Chaenocephalus aceratus]|uniref:Uncharacterized protein n=1 Tax=Chaenocephalus aceratus TaxID=36190 RepID=A0ACB9VRV9_CHAAC|nr:hypothetical protein KUCAC02_006424 [Chaenocephalus aceratus]
MVHWIGACFDLKVVTLNGVPVTPPKQNEETPWRPAAVDSTHIGVWCVIKYDDDVYPGIIMDVEGDSIQVKCMHRNGVNKYFLGQDHVKMSVCMQGTTSLSYTRAKGTQQALIPT